MEALAYTLYKWLGVQGIWLANQTVDLPCCLSTALILFPICTSLTFDIKKRGICLLLDSRVSTPIPLTSIPRRSNYGICNLSLRNRPVEAGTCGKLRVKDSNKCYLLICMYLFVYSFVFKLLIIIVLIIDIFIQFCTQI